jgi:hypothetical protein
VKGGGVKLATPAQISRALRSARARLGWTNRRIRDAEALAGQLIQWRKLRELHGDVVGDFTRAA